MKLGASDYITKPFKRDELIVVIERYCRSSAWRVKLIGYVRNLVKNIPLAILLVRVQRLKDFEIISNVSNTEANILIQGETGTGKELVGKGYTL